MANGWSISDNSCGQSTNRWADRVLGLARRQWWVVTRAQLLGLGVSAREVAYSVATGRLHRIHAGVYAVGRPPERIETHWMAAILAGGPGAVLSHRSAAELWELRRVTGGTIQVTAPQKRAPRQNVRFHRASLPADETTRRDGIAVTGPLRTIFDFASVAAPVEVERALHECELAGLGDRVGLDELVARHPRRAGAVALRAARRTLECGPAITRSELEERFLDFLDHHGLERPATNARVAAGERTIEVDCVWWRQRLIVELDGRRFHDSDTSFERDSATARALTAHGWRMIRITWRQLHSDPHLAGDLRAALAG